MSKNVQESSIQKFSFGKFQNGQDVHCYEFRNSNGIIICLLDYGLTIQKMILPDTEKKLLDVVLGFDNIEGYEGDHPYFGCLVGPNANRIKNGRVVIDGKAVQLVQNEGDNQLHSAEGFQRRIWDCTIKKDNEGQPFLECFYLKKAGEEGFPGNLKTQVRFQLTEGNILDMHYTATTDATTIVNLTRHDYFNLQDGGASSIFEHVLEINSQQITEKDTEDIPTGKVLDIKGTSYDFSTITSIQSNLDAKKPDLMPIAFDDNYVLENKSKKLLFAAKLIAPDAKRSLEIHSSQPGLQFYTGVHTKNQRGKNGVIYQPYSGLCLEAQHFPDAPNHASFENTIITPSEVYEHQLQYRFGTGE